jgi:hypothetical protein
VVGSKGEYDALVARKEKEPGNVEVTQQ